MPRKRRVVVVGLDGGSWNLINYMPEIYFPSIKRLMSHSVFSTLISTIPPITPVSWTSMVTGL